MNPKPIRTVRNATSLLAALIFCASGVTTVATAAESDELKDQLKQFEGFVAANCLDCHSADDAAGDLDLEGFDYLSTQFSETKFTSDSWEKILRRLATRQMPPPTATQPTEAEYATVTTLLSNMLDARAHRFPNPGQVGAIRRMTRLEYQHAIRDLLGIQVDAADLLPKDESSHGFDNITVSELSPTHLNRYLSAAQKISRAALGGLGNGSVGVTVRLPADRSQEEHVPGLPFGTRGGTLLAHHFPQTGEYEIELKLTRDRDEKIEGLDGKHEIDVLIDKDRVHQFSVAPPKGAGDWRGKDYTHADSHLRTRIKVTAGSHNVGITFPKTSSSLVESKRQPFDTNFNRHRHPRLTPAIYQISIVGPFEPQGRGKTQSRTRIFGETELSEKPSRDDAKAILQKLARRAYRRPVTEHDLDVLMRFYDEAIAAEDESGFETGLEAALAALLVNPNFLLRIENQQVDETGQRSVVPISDMELASRLSFFLWSSIPDEELLQLAEQGTLHEESVLREQVQRMLADERSRSLVDNFATQWLYLRNLDSITPDLRLFPDFDDNLRQAFGQETKLLFYDVLKNDRSALRLIDSPYTYLNERLATHYGIAGVTGSKFRKVPVGAKSHRGGMLRHGSILMVTSYATRTSPTIRGNWVMENIFGTPAPPPPPDVPNLKENSSLDVTSVRQRLAAHRANPACASCHDLIDPVGFSLENYDAVGRWRDFEGTLKVDSAGSLPDGTEIASVQDLEQGILKRPEIFAQTLTEKLLTFGLGRTLQPADGPAVRRVVKAAGEQDFSLSSLIAEIVLSDPFLKRSVSRQDDSRGPE